ncbi:MAG: VanW family protein [Deltaproteobacteria bacterium]|nr:VanW family protein [Deltaproteobacteria bacterium]
MSRAEAGGTRAKQRGAIWLGVAGGMVVVAAGFIAAYFAVGSRSVASAATTTPTQPEPVRGLAPQNMSAWLSRDVEVKTANGTTKLTWAELGIEVDADEAGRLPGGADLASLAAKGSLPVRIDRDKAIKVLNELKAKTDKAPINAYLDLEARKISDDQSGLGLDAWGSLPRLAIAARTGAGSVELATVAVPAEITKTGLGIDDISHVMGHYSTRFPVTDRDRNFNLKLAASKLDGVVLKPNEEWSFNGTVGERAEKEGYKIAHVITAGEMVDGLAGGTCQISTTLFGAAFFAGISIVDTTNHSRPSAYTPLGFDATVVWPNTDLKLKNPYEFPIVIHYVVANGEAKVEILGKERPYDKIIFERKVLEESPFTTEERLDDEIAQDETSIDQEGFPGYKLERLRKFIKNGKTVKTNKWTVLYKPVTEYIRRGTNPAPDAKKAEQKEIHSLKPPTGEEFKMAQ